MRSIERDDLGAKIGGGLILLAIVLGVGWFGPNAIPNLVTGFTAPTQGP